MIDAITLFQRTLDRTLADQSAIGNTHVCGAQAGHFMNGFFERHDVSFTNVPSENACKRTSPTRLIGHLARCDNLEVLQATVVD